MNYYPIKLVSKLTNATVRTLQYYDDIDLLTPAKRSDAGYRLYSDNDLLRLQQIMTLKYLGLSLSDIRKILEAPHFNILDSLNWQAQILTEKASKIQEASRLLQYIASQLEAQQPVNWQSTTTLIHILENTAMNNDMIQHYQNKPIDSELGKESNYDNAYNPKRLYAIPRKGKRFEIGIEEDNLPFHGLDYWNHYEVSWLNAKGKPVVATAEISYDCTSPFIVESKSLKLYFNSLNNSRFNTPEEVAQIIQRDLEYILKTTVTVVLSPLNGHYTLPQQDYLSGTCLDNLDIECSVYTVKSDFLTAEEDIVTETVYSDLLKSNCLVTTQPDWGSVQITYHGRKINHEGLLRYLVSYRNHNEFHEQCIERIFVDIMRLCQPKTLTVYGRYTRRGGIDINPYRSTEKTIPTDLNKRLVRQ